MSKSKVGKYSREKRPFSTNYNDFTFISPLKWCKHNTKDNFLTDITTTNGLDILSRFIFLFYLPFQNCVKNKWSTHTFASEIICLVHI